MKTLQKLSHLLLASAFFLLNFLWLLNANVYAQATGTLSISPSTATFTQNETKTFSVIWTGEEITAGELHITVGSGVNIVSFAGGEGITELINSPETGRFDFGKLSAGNITSGSTIMTMQIQATTCGATGTIGFNQAEVLIPDVTPSFQTSSYSVSCNGGGGVATTVTALPTTAIINDDVDPYLISGTLVISGIIVAYVLKTLRNNNHTTENLEIISENY